MDEQVVTMISEMVAKAKAAQKEFESFSQEQTDEVVRAIGKVIYDRAEELARMAWSTGAPSFASSARKRSTTYLFTFCVLGWGAMMIAF